MRGIVEPDATGHWQHPRLIRGLAIAQGLYYVATGVWPLVSIDTFMAVTGPKVDLWLVKTVGVLITVVGGVLLLGGIRRRVAVELWLLALGAATGLAAIDTIYVSLGRIPKIYLADAAVEILLIGLWIVAAVPRRRRPRK